MLLLSMDELQRLEAILQREKEPALLAKVQDEIEHERWQERLFDELASADGAIERLLSNTEACECKRNT